jgi:hypothetical protein
VVWFSSILASPEAQEFITPPEPFLASIASPVFSDVVQGDMFFKLAGVDEPASYDFAFDVNAGGTRWNCSTFAAPGDLENESGGGGTGVTYTVNPCGAGPESLQVVLVSALGAAAPVGASEAISQGGLVYTFYRPLDADAGEETPAQTGGLWVEISFAYGPAASPAGGAMLLA